MKFFLILAWCSVAPAADLADLARSAAPEFTADTLLRTEPHSIEQLEEAFTAASRAHDPVRVVAVFGTPPESRAAYRSKAGDLGLDRLSLETKVVKAMLPLDRAKARELFMRVARPMLDPRPCADPLVADASVYYETAVAVDTSVDFLKSVLSGVQSPNELAAFVHAIQSAKLNQADWDLLLAALGTKFETIDNDYRPFAMSVGWMRDDLEALAKKSPAAMLPLAVRTFLVAQMRAQRCDEEFGEAPAVVDWYNARFRGSAPAITEAERTPANRRGSIHPDPYFESEDSKGLGIALTALQFTKEGRPRGTADRATEEWRKLLGDFLRDLDAWKPQGGAVEVMQQKMYVLRAVLALTPAGPDRDHLLTTTVEFLKTSAALQESPAEWMWQVQSLR